MMRLKLLALQKAAAPVALADVHKDPEALLIAVKTAWGPDATLDDYSRFVARWRSLEARGRMLAEFVVTYGVLPPNPSRDDLDALDIAQPYAFALRLRVAAESQAVAGGGVGSEAYYATYTNGDQVEAKRLRHEALARKSLGG